jgi:chromosome segregation ATPase
LNNENSQLKEMIEADRDDVTDLEKTGHEVEELHLEIEQLREDSARTCRELEETVERLRFEKDKILENKDKKFLLVKERVKELEVENAQLQKLGNESRMCCDLERKIEDLENENRVLVRARNKTERDVEKLRLELDEVQDLLNRRNEKVLLAEKVGLTNDFVHNEAINLSTLTTMMLY